MGEDWTHLRLLTTDSMVWRWSLRYLCVPFSVTFFNWFRIRSIRYSILGIETIETFEIETLLYWRRGSPVSEIYPSSLTLVVTSDITSWDCSMRKLKKNEKLIMSNFLLGIKNESENSYSRFSFEVQVQKIRWDVAIRSNRKRSIMIRD